MSSNDVKKTILDEMAKLSPEEREAVVNELAAKGMFSRAASWLCASKKHADFPQQ